MLPLLCCQGGCVMKLEEFILSQLYILGALGIGIAVLQVKLWQMSPFSSRCMLSAELTRACYLLFQLFGMMFTCCLHHNLKDEPYWRWTFFSVSLPDESALRLKCLKMSSLKSSCWAALHSAKWLPFYVKGNAENESLMWLYLQMLDCTAVLGVSQGLVQEIDHMNNKNNFISSRYCGQCIYWESLVMHALWLKGWWDALHFFCTTGVHLMAHSSLYPQPISITSPTVSIIVELPLPFFPKV